jgi:Transposase DDE domain group 1
MVTARDIHYEIADRTRGLSSGGLGALHALAGQVGLIDAIDRHLHLLKFHFPYHESDHALTFAYNALGDGTCLQDLELRRTDEVSLDALGAQRIPDPTTAGDFCRRFGEAAIRQLRDCAHDVRVAVWAEQPAAFFEQATLAMAGFLVETTGQCKRGMDIAHDGTRGYHALVLTLANTGEVMGLVNRPAHRPSHAGAAAEVDRALAVCFGGGFRTILLRGDTDFSQTEHRDRGAADPRVHFIFGYDAAPNLVDRAEQLPERCRQALQRPPRYDVRTRPRQRPDNVKEAVVVRRAFENLKPVSEQVAEFNYRPTACRTTYRMVVARKNLSVEQGAHVLFEDVRYFFYLTNDWVSEAAEGVCGANGRCDQENLLAQVSGGVRALRAPVDSLVSNWAYLVMTALAWDLKAWWALLLPEAPGRWQERHRAQKHGVLRLEFKASVNAFVRSPCQLVRTGRRLVYRLLSWNPHRPIFFRLVDRLRC